MKKTTSILKNKETPIKHFTRNIRQRVAQSSFSPVIAMILCIVCFSANAPAADPPNEVLLDGISTVISFNSSDDSSAILILSSDVELMARILLVNQYGSAWKKHSIDNAITYKARRLASIVRVLAHVATLVGEKVDTAKRDAMISRFEKHAGGQSNIQELLNQCGAQNDDLKFWFSNLYMCQVQLQYLTDQVQMPSDIELKKMFKKGDHSLEGANWQQAKDAYEKIVRNEELQKLIAQWLEQFAQQGKINFVR